MCELLRMFPQLVVSYAVAQIGAPAPYHYLKPRGDFIAME